MNEKQKKRNVPNGWRLSNNPMTGDELVYDYPNGDTITIRYWVNSGPMIAKYPFKISIVRESRRYGQREMWHAENAVKKTWKRLVETADYVTQAWQLNAEAVH